MVGSMPFTSNTDVGFWRADRPRPAVPGEWPAAMYSAVGPDYFRTMRIPLLRGRGFTPQGDVHHPLVVIVDRDLAMTVPCSDHAVERAERMTRLTFW